MTTPVRIGLSSNYLHADPDRALYRNKTLLYAEQRMMRAVAATGALPILVEPEGKLEHYLDLVDGVLLTGGADVAPGSYGQAPIADGAWPGDPTRGLVVGWPRSEERTSSYGRRPAKA